MKEYRLEPEMRPEPIKLDPIQGELEVNLDGLKIIVDGDVTFFDGKQSFGKWIDEDSRVKLADKTEQDEIIFNLLEPQLPYEDGIYSISGYLYISYIIDNIYMYQEYYNQEESYDLVDWEDAEVEFDYGNSYLIDVEINKDEIEAEEDEEVEV